MSTIKFPGKRLAKALAFTMALTACQSSSHPLSSDEKAKVRVTEITPVVVDTSASAQEGVPEICQSWSPTAAQAEKFFELSQEIDARTFHVVYDTAPCKATGTVKAEGRVWKFQINGAAKASWSEGKDVRYFGCSVPACKPLVMWMPDDVTAD